MYGRFFLRVLLGLLVITMVIGFGVSAYRMGMLQGTAQATSDDTVAPLTTRPHFYGPPFHHFWGFGCFGLLVPLLFLFLLFGGLRALFWHGHWGHHGHGHWRTDHPGWEKAVPPMFDEWHKHAHEQKADAPGDTKAV